MLSVVVPAVDSAGTIVQVLAGIYGGLGGIAAEIVVAAGGSADNTREIVQRIREGWLAAGLVTETSAAAGRPVLRVVYLRDVRHRLVLCHEAAKTAKGLIICFVPDVVLLV